MMDNGEKNCYYFIFLNKAHHCSQLARSKVKDQKSNYIRVRVEVLPLWPPAWPLHITSSMSKSVSCEPCGLKFASELVSGVIKWMDFHLGHETYTVSYQMARWPRPLGGGGRGLGMRLGVYRQAGRQVLP